MCPVVNPPSSLLVVEHFLKSSITVLIIYIFYYHIFIPFSNVVIIAMIMSILLIISFSKFPNLWCPLTTHSIRFFIIDTYVDSFSIIDFKIYPPSYLHVIISRTL